jgi:hypothetical protein
LIIIKVNQKTEPITGGCTTTVSILQLTPTELSAEEAKYILGANQSLDRIYETQVKQNT